MTQAKEDQKFTIEINPLECVVCLQNLNKDDFSVQSSICLPCGHRSHCRACIILLSSKSKTISCPQCRHNSNLFCSVTASLFLPEGGRILNIPNISLKTTQESLKKTIEGLYQTPHKISKMTVRGSFMFYPGKTLIEMGVVPESSTLVWVFYN